jgi:hypothetical protein
MVVVRCRTGILCLGRCFGVVVVTIHPVPHPGIIFLPAKILQLRQEKEKLESDAAEHHKHIEQLEDNVSQLEDTLGKSQVNLIVRPDPYIFKLYSKIITERALEINDVIVCV